MAWCGRVMVFKWNPKQSCCSAIGNGGSPRVKNTFQSIFFIGTKFHVVTVLCLSFCRWKCVLFKKDVYLRIYAWLRCREKIICHEKNFLCRNLKMFGFEWNPTPRLSHYGRACFIPARFAILFIKTSLVMLSKEYIFWNNDSSYEFGCQFCVRKQID